ncbi:AAA family ATPase [Nostoc sp. ChiSLP03a]|uniref:AAA family ATPase n=1 Tax=Nostoc sp. ChiSLP03a TaxID=3075380 RepID=UPI002AD2DC6D|nr:AAA family ATPase [Nostoc sp. ChiSLP03a]MDZ8211841.1 AAA family ATPase [Nostoc sp. ChiSLP03a]
MLKQLILENWKSFRYAELPLDPLTVLIGTNASGKSNVVEALEFLQITFTRQDVKPALVGDSILTSIRGGVEWAAFKPEKKFTLKAVIQGQDINTDYIYAITVKTKPSLQVLEESIIYQEYKISFDENIVRDFVEAFYLNKKEIGINNSYNNYILMGNFLPTQTYLTDVLSVEADMNSFEMKRENIYNFYHFIRNIFILNPIPSKMRSYSPIGEKLETDASNIAGILAGLSKKRKAEVEAALSNYIKELPEGDIQKVWAQKVGRFRTDAMLYSQEEWKPGHITEIDARSMSDGTLRFLAIITALLTRPEGSQIVIEEIDNGLHPSRAGLLVRILREIGQKRKIDILLTTHNPALLDALGPEIVPFVVVAHRDKETGESKLTLLEDIENLPLLLASGSLGKLATKGAIEKSLSDNK